MSEEKDEVTQDLSNHKHETPSQPAGEQPAPPTVPTAVPQSQVPAAQPHHATSQSHIWRMFLAIIAGGLIISAIISVAAILFGGANGVVAKSLLTTLSVVIHSLVALALLQATPVGQKPRFIVQVVFATTIGSLIASVVGTWEIVDNATTGNFYQLFMYMLLCGSVAELLFLASKDDSLTRSVKYVSIALDALLLIYLVPWIFFEKTLELPDLYYRGIAAISILLGTTAILTAIAHMLYRAKHPKQQTAQIAQHKTDTGMIVFWTVFGIFMFFATPFMLFRILGGY